MVRPKYSMATLITLFVIQQPELLCVGIAHVWRVPSVRHRAPERDVLGIFENQNRTIALRYSEPIPEDCPFATLCSKGESRWFAGCRGSSTTIGP